jgi:hypothetical protein
MNKMQQSIGGDGFANLVNVIFANQVLIFGGGDDDERTLAG